MVIEEKNQIAIPETEVRTEAPPKKPRKPRSTTTKKKAPKESTKNPEDIYQDKPENMTPKERIEVIKFFQENLEKYQTHNQSLHKASQDAFARYAELEEKYKLLQIKLNTIRQNVTMLYQNTLIIFKED